MGHEGRVTYLEILHSCLCAGTKFGSDPGIIPEKSKIYSDLRCCGPVKQISNRHYTKFAVNILKYSLLIGRFMVVLRCKYSIDIYIANQSGHFVMHLLIVQLNPVVDFTCVDFSKQV